MEYPSPPPSKEPLALRMILAIPSSVSFGVIVLLQFLFFRSTSLINRPIRTVFCMIMVIVLLVVEVFLIIRMYRGTKEATNIKIGTTLAKALGGTTVILLLYQILPIRLIINFFFALFLHVLAMVYHQAAFLF